MQTHPHISAGNRGSQANTLKAAEAVLRPLFGKQTGTLSRCEQGDNAITFELSQLSGSFQPAKGNVLAKYEHVGKDTHGEREVYYVLEIDGHLVRLATFQFEAIPGAKGRGAIYTGPNKEDALQQALRSFSRLKH